MIWLFIIPFLVLLLICALIDQARRCARDGDDEGASRYKMRAGVVVALVCMAAWTLQLMLKRP